MKLSVVVPIYKDSKFLEKFLQEMQRQELQDFELVLVLDTNGENNLRIIDSYKGFFQGRLALIYNTKRSGRTRAIFDGVKKAKGSYVLICSVSDVVLKDAIKELVNLIVTQPSDIIEFIPRMRSPIRFKGYLRKDFFKPITLADNSSPIAYTFPFDFNKLFAREVLLRALEDTDYNKIINTRFAIIYVLKSFYYAKTYSNISKKIIRSKLNNVVEISPLIIAKQWEEMRHYIANKQNNLYIQEFDYLSYYHEVAVLTSFVAVLNRKSVVDKYRKYLQKQVEQYFGNKIDHNKYFLADNIETKAFREAKSFYDYSKLLKSLN